MKSAKMHKYVIHAVYVHYLATCFETEIVLLKIKGKLDRSDLSQKTLPMHTKPSCIATNKQHYISTYIDLKLYLF